MSMFPTLADLSMALAEGRITATALVETALDAIANPSGEGARVYLRVDAEGARQSAAAIDRARSRGASVPPYAGIPVSVKDLFDIQGQTTTAGSVVLADRPPAQSDAAAVAQLRAAGFVVMGRTNMTEFAYSGLGLNPHYGTPLNPYDRATGRIPGGSSSGAAIAVTDGMAAVSLGTDTGGSCRIPAALTGLTGYKPTASRVSSSGALPLSTALDSIGPIGRTVNCCAIVDSILSAEPAYLEEFFPVTGLRIAIPKTQVLDDCDNHVLHAFEHALQRLSNAGAKVIELPFPEFSELADINAKGGYTAAESYRWHRELLARFPERYDPRVRVRIERGAGQTPDDIAQLDARRADWIARVSRRFEGVDVIACPTVPLIAPKLTDLDDDAEYSRVNLLMLRNPTFINFLDGCAISLPCHSSGSAPVGLMLASTRGQDRKIFAVARTVEAILQSSFHATSSN